MHSPVLQLLQPRPVMHPQGSSAPRTMYQVSYHYPGRDSTDDTSLKTYLVFLFPRLSCFCILKLDQSYYLNCIQITLIFSSVG